MVARFTPRKLANTTNQVLGLVLWLPKYFPNPSSPLHSISGSCPTCSNCDSFLLVFWILSLPVPTPFPYCCQNGPSEVLVLPHLCSPQSPPVISSANKINSTLSPWQTRLQLAPPHPLRSRNWPPCVLPCLQCLLPTPSFSSLRFCIFPRRNIFSAAVREVPLLPTQCSQNSLHVPVLGIPHIF